MKDDQFKKIIKAAGLEEPGPSFTDDLMRKIATQEDLSISPVFQQMLKASALQEPAENFTEKLMAHIPQEKPEFSDPIISRKTFYVLAGIVAIITIVASVIFRTPEDSILPSIEKKNFYTWIEQGMDFFVNSQMIFLCLIAATILLLSDYIFRVRFSKLAG